MTRHASPAGPPASVHGFAAAVATSAAGAPRVALVHDWLNQAGGAEAVLEVLHAMYPAAPVYAALADARRVPAIAGWDVRASWMDRLPGIHGHHQPFLPLYPLAWRSTRLRGFDVVVSNKSGFCHGVDAGDAVHVCYCLTPTRFVWQPEAYVAGEDLPRGAEAALALVLPLLRRWDLAAAARVDRFVAISGVVRDRIAAVYGRESDVIHPPVDVERFRPADDAPPADDAGGYFLVLSRLVPYKQIDLAVEAFNRLNRPLVVVGDGRDRERLERLAGPNVTFRGRLADPEVAGLAARCRALVWPGVEDFGLAPVEVMAAGRPVIARRAGGVLDTVVEGRTGMFFDTADPDALAAAVRAADDVAWDPGAIRRHALGFGRPLFEARLRACVEDAWRHGREARAAAVRRGPGWTTRREQVNGTWTSGSRS